MVSEVTGGVESTSDIGAGGSNKGTVGSSTGISELKLRSSVSSCLVVGLSISSVNGTASASEGVRASAQVFVIVGVGSSADVMGSTKTTAGLG